MPLKKEWELACGIYLSLGADGYYPSRFNVKVNVREYMRSIVRE